MLSALHAAHQVGVTHRDVKPANVLLEGDRVILADFGIAAVDGDTTLTRTGGLVGTPAFMSPEQVRGDGAGAASDLWSLGATMYSAVEGRPPFDGTSTGAVFVAITTEDPAPAVNAGPLEPAISGLLRKNPSERLTADQLHAILAQLTADRQAPPDRIQPPIPRSHAPRRRRRPALIAVGITAVLTVTAAVAVPGYLVYGRSPSVYETNLRAARNLGAPPGFTRTSVTNVGGGRVRVSFGVCPDATPCSGVPWMLNVARQWLRSKPSVQQVVDTDEA